MLEEGNKKIILASSSPRRREIMELLRLNFSAAEPEGCKETILEEPEDTVIENSRRKAENVFENFGEKSNYIIAGFDTIVYMDGRYFGKPKSLEEAKQFIRAFSGRIHNVVTGTCIIDARSGNYFKDFDTTQVEFRKLSGPEIESYVISENVFDKAGAYNIASFGSVLVKKINGCYYNVMGLPLAKFISLLKKVNYKIL